MEHLDGYCCLAGMLGFAVLLLVSLWWKPSEDGPRYWELYDEQDDDQENDNAPKT